MLAHAVKIKLSTSAKKKVPQQQSRTNVVVVKSTDILSHINKWNAYKKIDVIKEGVSKKQFEDIKKRTGLDYETLAAILAVTKATLHNKKGDARFSAAVSERILLLADIYTYGYEVWGDDERFNHWMFNANKGMCGKKPIDMLHTLYGIQEVRDAIGRIDYGVYS